MRLLKRSIIPEGSINHEEKLPGNKIFGVLNEAATYVEYYKDQTIIICLDDSIIYDTKAFSEFAEDIVLLKNFGINIVIVHDAEHSVISYGAKYGVEITSFDKEMIINSSKIEFVEMVALSINQKIVAKINALGGMALGLSGKDACLAEAASKFRKSKPCPSEEKVKSMPEVNYCGKVSNINPTIVSLIDSTDVIPVISSLSYGDGGKSIYVTAVDFISALYQYIGATTVVFYAESWLDEISKNLLDSEISLFDFQNKASKILGDGDAKLNFCLDGLEDQLDYIHFINYSNSHSLLLNLLSDQKTGCVVY